jgi:hypothetical protein
MYRSVWRGLALVVRASVRLLYGALRVCLLALGCAGPPLPAHEIRGRTPAVQHESGSRRE